MAGDPAAAGQRQPDHYLLAAAEPSRRTAGYLAEALSRGAGHPVTRAQIGLPEPAGGPPLTGADPARTATVLGRADVEHHIYLAAAAFTVAHVRLPLAYDHEAASRMLRARAGTGMAGAAEIEVIRQVTAVFGVADEILGGGHGLTLSRLT